MDASAERRERFERLYRCHEAAVLAYALRRCPREAAADVAAETFAVAWRRLDDVKEGEALPWLYGIARRVLSSQRRSERRQEAIADRVAAELEVEGPAPVEGASGALRAALAALSEGEREVLLLAAWEELSSRQAAAVLGCSPTAFRLRLHRARRALRRLLAEHEHDRPPTPIRPAIAPTTKETL